MPLLDDETFTRFGYHLSDVSSKAVKAVAYACDDCKKIFTRQRRRVTDLLLCHGCAIRRPHAPEQQQKFEATMMERYGVKHALHSPELKQRMADSNIKKYGVANPSSLPESRLKKQAWWFAQYGGTPLPVGALREETIRVHGHDPVNYSTTSDIVVVCQCSTCLTIFERSRRNIVEPVRCQHCLAKDVPVETWRRAIAKRAITTQLRYGKSGLPSTSKVYGKAQNKLAQLVEVLVGQTVRQNRPLDGRKSIDIYVENKQIGIEYCGLKWHHERVGANGVVTHGSTHHKAKMDLAAAEGIRLITVFENEWLERPAQVENVLKAIFGISTRRLVGRKCQVKEIPCEEARKFVGAYHLQPHKLLPEFAWGLFYGEELVGVITAGPHHRQGQGRVLVLQRLCFKTDVYVLGGSEKLFKALRERAPSAGYTSIRSWSDNRWFTGAIYPKLGFTLTEELPPDYSYVQAPAKLLSKQSQKKSAVNCPAGLTEKEWALERGLHRIWDCGKKRWDLQLTEKTP